MLKLTIFRKLFLVLFVAGTVLSLLCAGCATFDREAKREAELRRLQERFEWWPTDAKPGPVKDDRRSGYWWWPDIPGEAHPWGNRGYIYLYKIIYDYRADELPPPEKGEPRPSLLVKKIIKNVKIYFDFDKAGLREDHLPILENAVKILKRNSETDILITGNCDRRGSGAYNLRLGNRRGEAVRQFMLDSGIADERIRIISRGKLDAVAPLSDLVGMQKDRNAHFVIAEVEDIMMSREGEISPDAREVREGTYLIEEEESLESGIKVSTREYTVRKGDTLGKIARRELGAVHRWKYIYAINEDRIKDPNKLRAGQTILIPVE